ncbi:MAG: anion permease [archaeon]
MAWNVGANNTANIMGIPVGSGVLSLRGAVMIVLVLEILGVVFYGGNVARTVGTDMIGTYGMRLVEAIAVMALVGGFVTLASFFRVPMSSTQVLVGCVVGYALATSSILNWGTVFGIALSWVISPFIGILFGFVGYYAVRRYFLSDALNMDEVRMIFGVFVALEVASAAMLAFAQGANSIAAIVGVFSGVVPLLSSGALLVMKVVGGVGVGAGMAMWGYRVIRTISSRIVAMDPAMCFVSQISAAIIVLLFTFFGMPVSSVHVVVGTVIGVGLISGARMIHWNVIYEIAGSWVFVVPLSAFVSFAFIRALIVFV